MIQACPLLKVKNSRKQGWPKDKDENITFEYAVIVLMSVVSFEMISFDSTIVFNFKNNKL